MFYGGKTSFHSKDSFGVGAYGTDNAAGTIFLFEASGESSFPARINITDYNVLNSTSFGGLSVKSALGWQSSGGTDINGDGINDFVVSAPGGGKAMIMEFM